MVFCRSFCAIVIIKTKYKNNINEIGDETQFSSLIRITFSYTPTQKVNLLKVFVRTKQN